MARTNLSENIDAGMLTTGNLAIILNATTRQVRSLVNNAIQHPRSYFPVYVSQEGNMRYVPAGPFLDYCQRNNIPSSTELLRAADNYEHRLLNDKNALHLPFQTTLYN